MLLPQSHRELGITGVHQHTQLISADFFFKSKVRT